MSGPVEAARLTAQKEFRRPLLVEAGAGTGKTATLVARILSWCLGPGWERASDQASPEEQAPEKQAATVLSRVAAITFTEAAAREMAERLADGLTSVARGEAPIGFLPPERIWDHPVDPTEVRRRAALLRQAIEALQVRTIHSFCYWMLAAHPFEAGLHPRFQVDADGSTLRQVVEEVVEASLPAAYGDPGEAAFLFLASRGFGPREIADLLEALATAGLDAADLAEDPLAPERLGELRERLWQGTNRLLTVLELRLPDAGRAPAGRRGPAEVVRGLQALRSTLRRGDTSVETLQAAVREHLPPPVLERLALWGRGETANTNEMERLAGAGAKLRATAAPLERLARHLLAFDAALLENARSAILPLLRQVRRELRRRGAVGFNDLLRGAHDLAVRHPALLRQVRRRIDQLLVDEFQDTDRLQCELIRRLALDGPAAERPGLFVVGDPKQSIYGWRNADLRAYEAFAAAVEEAGGQRLTLGQNFRSPPSILAEVERIVAPVMEREPGVQPEFRPLVPTRPERPELCSELCSEEGARPTVEHWVSWAGDDEKETANARATAELEARALARDLLEQHRRGVTWRDAAVLLRSFTDLETYLAALRDASIPFAVSRDRQYYRRREVIDAAACVRAILAPDDPVALVAYLRCAAVGVPDAALLPLWNGGLPRFFRDVTENEGALEALLRRTRDALTATPVPGLDRLDGWDRQLLQAVHTVRHLRRTFEDEPADVFVEALRRSTLLEATEGARTLGAYRLANLERFFADLLAALIDEDGDRHAILRRLRRRVSEGSDAEEARPRETENAVRILTIHKAKGLEFPHVYLLQTHKEAGLYRPAVPLEIGAVRAGAPHSGATTGPARLEYRLFSAATPGFDLLQGQRDELAGAELVRTLYVALTRASERLVIAGRRPPGAPPPLANAATHMDLLLHRRGTAPSTEELLETWRGGEHQRLVDGVLWSLPRRAPAAPASPSRPPVEEAGARPDVDAEPRRQEGLRRRRNAAREEREKPFRRRSTQTTRLSPTGLDALHARLENLGDRLLARDLPVLLPEDTLVVDVLYRDDAGAWIVAELENSLVDADEIGEHARRRAAEATTLIGAVQDALGLAGTPGFEVWYLAADHVERPVPSS